MATRVDSSIHVVEPIAPSAPPSVEDTVIQFPDLSRTDYQNAVLSYNRPSDILLVFFGDRDRPTVAAGGSGHVYALVDPDTNEVLGLQLDDFLARVVTEDPRLIEVLSFADLVGLTDDALRRERQRVLGEHEEAPTQPDQRERRREDVLRELIGRHRPRFAE